MRHGDWPSYVPPEDAGEGWRLYEQLAAPIVEGDCACHALCACDNASQEGADVA